MEPLINTKIRFRTFRFYRRTIEQTLIAYKTSQYLERFYQNIAVVFSQSKLVAT
jgi:hypothetical protein